jgi:hypothetical protein
VLQYKKASFYNSYSLKYQERIKTKILKMELGMNMNMSMPMFFTNNFNFYLLFENWMVMSNSALVGSCFGWLILSFLLEAIKGLFFHNDNFIIETFHFIEIIKDFKLDSERQQYTNHYEGCLIKDFQFSFEELVF